VHGVDNCKTSFISVITIKGKEKFLTCIRKTINTTVSSKKLKRGLGLEDLDRAARIIHRQFYLSAP
jgi:hypothetical protein